MLDDDERIAHVVGYIGQHDLDALDKAQSLSKTHQIEIWSENRKVGRVKKGDAPRTPKDGTSL